MKIQAKHHFKTLRSSINRGMAKEDVRHIRNGILLNQKEEWNWVICRDTDGPRDCHSEWSKSEKEKQISYINAYVWNLEKWYRLSYLQNRNRNTNVENKRMESGGIGGRMNWEIAIDIYALLIFCIKWITNENLFRSSGNPTQCSVVT